MSICVFLKTVTKPYSKKLTVNANRDQPLALASGVRDQTLALASGVRDQPLALASGVRDQPLALASGVRDQLALCSV